MKTFAEEGEVALVESDTERLEGARLIDKVALQRVKSHIPASLITILEQWNSANPLMRVFIAGGFIRSVFDGTKHSDIDIFCSCTAAATAFYSYCRDMVGIGKDADEIDIASTDFAFNLIVDGKKVQIICNADRVGSPFLVLGKFDFTCCMGAIWPINYNHGWTGIVTGDFVRDTKEKRLVYRAPKREEVRGDSLLRSYKFARLGYTINTCSIARLCARVLAGSRVNLDEFAEGQIAAYFEDRIEGADPDQSR